MHRTFFCTREPESRERGGKDRACCQLMDRWRIKETQFFAIHFIGWILLSGNTSRVLMVCCECFERMYYTEMRKSSVLAEKQERYNRWKRIWYDCKLVSGYFFKKLNKIYYDTMQGYILLCILFMYWNW